MASDGNLNSSVEMGEDEMQAFGRVDAMFERMAHSQDNKAGEKPKIQVDKVLASIQVSGFGQFSEENWGHCIDLRKVLPTAMAKCLQVCQFNAVASRVRVRSCDFGAVAKLDPHGHRRRRWLCYFGNTVAFCMKNMARSQVEIAFSRLSPAARRCTLRCWCPAQ